MERNDNNMYTNNYNGTNQPQPMHQPQSMYQSSPKKSNKKLAIIIGIIISLVVIISATIIVILILNSTNNKLLGHWTFTEKRTTFELIFENDGQGTIIVTQNNNKNSLRMNWSYEKDSEYIIITIKENLDGKPASMSFKLIEITDDAMIVSSNGQTGTFIKID